MYLLNTIGTLIRDHLKLWPDIWRLNPRINNSMRKKEISQKSCNQLLWFSTYENGVYIGFSSFYSIYTFSELLIVFVLSHQCVVSLFKLTIGQHSILTYYILALLW